MGRAGAGGGRSGGFSGGGHSSVSRSSGGHRASFGGSSRAGSSRSTGMSSSSSSSNRSGGFGSPFSYASNRRSSGGGINTGPIIVSNGGGGGLFGRSSVGCGGCLTGIIVVAVILIIFLAVSSMFSSNEPEYVNTVEVPASSYNREKLEGTSWKNDCVTDELGWVSEGGSVSGLEKQLRNFFDETGIQPYAVLLDYRPELTTDPQKQQFAEQWYDENIGGTTSFAFFYFGERNPDDVGFMCYVGGAEALGIMDSEAVDIFWAICDQEWYSDATTEDAIANTFNRTADRIMTKTATKADNMRVVLIIILVIVIAAAIIYIMNKRRKQEKERNEETRRILETPLE